jgi:Flp pilus assembly protein TadG
MKKVVRKYRRPQEQRRRGAAMVEAALVLPIMVTMVLGVVEFGRAQMVSQIVTNAAREGARAAIRDDGSNASVTQIVQTFLNSSLGVDPNNVAVSVTVTPAAGNPDPANECGDANIRDLVTVSVTLPFDDISFVPGHFLSGQNLLGQCAMRHM